MNDFAEAQKYTNVFSAEQLERIQRDTEMVKRRKEAMDIKLQGDIYFARNMLTDSLAAYEKAVKQETELTAEQLVVATVGKVDAKKRIEDAMLRLMSANIVQCLGTMLSTVVF